MRADRQRDLPFAGRKEQARLDKIERLWGDDKRIKTAAKMFDFDKATAIAKGKPDGSHS